MFRIFLTVKTLKTKKFTGKNLIQSKALISLCGSSHLSKQSHAAIQMQFISNRYQRLQEDATNTKCLMACVFYLNM